MPKLNGGHLFIRCLKMEGIEKVFTIVGDTILPLVDAAADEGIEFIDTRHEGAALHMADGYARITGRPASASSQEGRGSPTPFPRCPPSTPRKARWCSWPGAPSCRKRAW